MKENRPVALITGVGPGTGAAMARRFVRGGYLAFVRVVLVGTPRLLSSR
jgi:NAD(P)-dependent dehydrogenase (short-subunit alcohol dehydrogenase family)